MKDDKTFTSVNKLMRRLYCRTVFNNEEDNIKGYVINIHKISSNCCLLISDVPEYTDNIDDKVWVIANKKDLENIDIGNFVYVKGLAKISDYGKRQSLRIQMHHYFRIHAIEIEKR